MTGQPSAQQVLHFAYSILALFDCYYLFVVSPLHTATMQHAATYISNGPKYCHNDISSGIAFGKNDTIQIPRTHSFWGSSMTP